MNRKIDWTKEKEKLQTLHDQGRSQSEIANHYGVAQGIISLALKRHGIKTRPAGGWDTRRKLQSKVRLGKISEEELHLKVTDISYHCKTCGTESRKDFGRSRITCSNCINRESREMRRKVPKKEWMGQIEENFLFPVSMFIEGVEENRKEVLIR